MSALAGITVNFAGSGAFGVPTLRRLVDEGVKLGTVVSQPNRPAGRGMRETPPPLAGFALSRGLPLVQTDDLNKLALPPADVLVVIAFGQKIAPHVADAPKFGAVNLHASILPKYRGAAPIQRAVIEGETVVGNSVIRLAERMDAGAVLGVDELAVGEVETAGELHDRLAEHGAPLVVRVLLELAGGTSRELMQDDAQATRAPKLTRADAVLDFTLGAEALACRVRGTHPWPGCRVRVLDGEQELARVTLVRARGVAGTGAPGALDADGLVGTPDGRLEVVELQPEGGRAMPLDAYRRGRPWRAGLRLESVV